VNVCSCRHRLNGPRCCSSTNRHGYSYSVIAEVILNMRPKCLARQVTASPSPMIPLVTPPTARSPDALIEAVWASTDSDRLKQSLAGAAINVSRRMKPTTPVKPAR